MYSLNIWCPYNIYLSLYKRLSKFSVFPRDMSTLKCVFLEVIVPDTGPWTAVRSRQHLKIRPSVHAIIWPISRYWWAPSSRQVYLLTMSILQCNVTLFFIYKLFIRKLVHMYHNQYHYVFQADMKSDSLSLVTYICIGISGVCLLVTIFVHFCYWRYGHIPKLKHMFAKHVYIQFSVLT